MAARKRNGGALAENTRLRIKTSMLLNRLTDHIIGKIELSTSQVRAIEILLKKTLPDLQSTELHGSIDQAQPTINITMSQPVKQVTDNTGNVVEHKPKLKQVK